MSCCLGGGSYPGANKTGTPKRKKKEEKEKKWPCAGLAAKMSCAAQIPNPPTTKVGGGGPGLDKIHLRKLFFLHLILDLHKNK
jgi:hypothetical protein